MVKLFNTSIVGSPTKQIWSQAQSKDYGEGRQLQIVLSLECDEAESIIELAPIGAEIIQILEQKCSVAHDDMPLSQIVESVIDGLSTGVVAHILVGQSDDDKIIMYGKGSVEAYLSRGGKLARLKSEWGEGETLNGTMIPKDVLLLTTSKLILRVGKDNFSQILLEDKNPAEALAPLIHAKNDSSGIGAIVSIAGSESNNTAWPVITLHRETPRRLNLWVGGVILLLLIVMIGLGMTKRVALVNQRAFDTLDKSVAAKIEETVSIGDLNPERARNLLIQGKSEVETYLSTDIKEEYRLKANKLINDLKIADEQAFKKNEIELRDVVALPILIEGLNANKMKSDGKGNLAFLDTSSTRVVIMNIADRSRQVVDYLEDISYLDIAQGEGRVYALGSKGVYEAVLKSESASQKIEADEFWSEPMQIGTFAGNVYVFDKGQSEIWKYPTLGTTYGARRRWLAAGITPDLTNVVDMKVAGDIWLLTSTGKLERYSKGAPVKFGMEGFPGTQGDKILSDPIAMWVGESLIYVIERGEQRIVVFGDDGKYKSQYVNSEFANASDLVVVDDKAYVLIDNVVKEFGL